MTENQRTGSFQEGSLDTLAQNRTRKTGGQAAQPEMRVKGKGTDLRNIDLWKKAKKKTITQVLMLKLIDVAMRKGKPERVHAYWNTFYCQSNIISTENKLYGNYCKNRFCLGCSNIRKSEIINKYLPAIKSWRDSHFMTLTSLAVPANKLPGRVKAMQRAFTLILDKNRKDVQRHGMPLLIGLKTLESNFNPAARTYNPHFHLIVFSEEVGLLLLREWERVWTGNGNRKYFKLMSMNAQDMQKVWDPEICLIEIVKYFSKVFTLPDPNYKGPKKVSPYVYLSALDNIIWAMRERRMLGSFGFKLSDMGAEVEKSVTQPKVVTGYEEWRFELEQNDWVNSEDPNELLLGYKPTRELIDLLTNNINTVLQ